MAKQAISVTLDRENLVWLRARSRALARASVSQLLDRLVTEARTGQRPLGAPSRSVVGSIRISESDPDLAGADAAVRALFLPDRPPPVRRRSRASDG